MSLKGAIIGCGAIAAEHADAISRIDGLELAAYCDVAPERAQAFLQRYGGAYATDDVDRLLADDAIDVVHICTLHDSHAILTEKACSAGKQIMLEKPMALTIADCMRIAEAVERSGVTLMTAFKLRFYPMVERARSFIERPVVTVAQVMDTRWPDDFWGQDPVLGGGNVLSQGCHAMDLVCYLNRAEPVSIHAEGGAFTHPDSTVIDTMVSTIRFSDGRVASVAQADAGATPYVSKWSFQMVDGVRSVHLHDRLKQGVFYDGERTVTAFDDGELGMLRENEAFVQALRSGAEPPTTYRDGLRATVMLLKAFESIRTGTPQRIEL